MLGNKVTDGLQDLSVFRLACSGRNGLRRWFMRNYYSIVQQLVAKIGRAISRLLSCAVYRFCDVFSVREQRTCGGSDTVYSNIYIRNYMIINNYILTNYTCSLFAVRCSLFAVRCSLFANSEQL